MKRYRVAAVPGDGVGKEIMPLALNILQAVAEHVGTFELEIEVFPWGCEHYLETGEVMPPDGIQILGQFDAIYFVAAGHPAVTDYLSAWELIFPMRQRFQQYINVRPVRSWRGVNSYLAHNDKPVDFVIVRENSEGEYAGPGGDVHLGQTNEVALQISVFTRTGVERVARFAFDLARTRRKHVVNITKSNALRHGLVFWDRVIGEVAQEYPDVTYQSLYVDAAAMRFVQSPESFDVLVTTNMFGDILSDLGGGMMGSIGLCPSANLNPEKLFPSMFEPIHGSAPDIAGKGLANPVGTILSGAMMLEHLGEPQAAALITTAVERVLAAGIHTGDLGGTATTQDICAAVNSAMGALLLN